MADAKNHQGAHVFKNGEYKGFAKQDIPAISAAEKQSEDAQQREHITNPSTHPQHPGCTYGGTSSAGNTTDPSHHGKPDLKPLPKKASHTSRTSKPSKPIAETIPESKQTKPHTQDEPQRGPVILRAEEWMLPKLEKPTLPNDLQFSGTITPQGLCWVIQNATDEGDILDYVNNYHEACVQSVVNQFVNHVNSLFYAADRGFTETIRLLARFGGNINVRSPPSDLPLIAFTIMSGWANGRVSQSTEIVRALLSLGADHTAIPMDMWVSYIDQPTVDPHAKQPAIPQQKSIDVPANPSAQWCTPLFRPTLAVALNLTQRYLLATIEENCKFSRKSVEIARACNIFPLLGLPLSLIAQRFAVDKIQEALLHKFMDPTSDRRPLVMLFGGPSGHGKTEVARRMGELLNLPYEFIDCSHLEHETDLFGPKAPYYGHSDGSSLNNFLAKHSGSPSVVFMDEFEKTDIEVHNALLLPFEDGTYSDRRKTNGERIDCSKTIWILATNLVDREILSFYDIHLNDATPAQREKAPYAVLQRTMRTRLRDRTKALSGRIMHIIPFFPFSASEAAVVAHKYILNLGADLYDPILAPDPLNPSTHPRHIGHIELSVLDEAAVCLDITNREYMRPDGARSIEMAMTREVKYPVFRAWRNMAYRCTEEINKGNRVKIVVGLVRERSGAQVVDVRVERGEAVMNGIGV